MMATEAEEVLSQIEYKPGWRLVYWFDRSFLQDLIWIKWEFEAVDAYDPSQTVMMESVSHLLPFFSEEQILREVFHSAQRAELHESAEFFTYKGERPFDPHKSLLHNGERYAVEA